MLHHIRPALIVLTLLGFLTGVIYPLAITGTAQLLFPYQANGSLITINGRVVGSHLVAQPFASDRYFWPRPSATSPAPWNGAASSGSNLGPTNLALKDSVVERIAALRTADASVQTPVPVDLVTASASGLDPHLSPAAARVQAPRVAKARGIPLARVLPLIENQIEQRTFGVFGEPRVNVLALNLALDGLRK